MNGRRTEKKKLFVFHTEFLFLRGGEKYVYELISRMTPRYEIVLYVETITPEWQKKFDDLHVPVYFLWKPPHLYWLLLPLTLLINTFRVRTSVRKDDSVFATSFPLSLLSTIVSNKSIVFCFEPLSVFYDTQRITHSPLKDRFFLHIISFFYKPLDRLAVKRARTLATLNEPVAAAIWRRYHRKPLVFIPNGVNTEFFSPRAQAMFRKPFPQSAYIIGHSTDYTILKGTEHLLHALPYVVQKHNNVRLLISESISNKKMRRKYDALINTLHIRKFVHFIGCVPEAKLAGFYTSCNVFCYCGSTECVGGSSASLSVLEAESCGIPVLRTLGNSDEIIPRKTGFYFKKETPSVIASGILRFMGLPKKTVSYMKVSARRHVQANFSWEYSAEKFSSII